MERKIEHVLNELQKAADYEELHKNEMNPDERMLAVTRDTAIFYNILLKTMSSRKIPEIGFQRGILRYCLPMQFFSILPRKLMEVEIIQYFNIKYKGKRGQCPVCGVNFPLE